MLLLPKQKHLLIPKKKSRNSLSVIPHQFWWGHIGKLKTKRMLLSDAMRIAQASGWQVKYINKAGFYVGFTKDGVLLNVHLKRNVVSTVLVHPKLGKNKLYRHDINANLLESLLQNPREHTGRGFRVRKRSRNKTMKKKYNPKIACAVCGLPPCQECWLEEPHYRCEHSTSLCSIKRLKNARTSRTTTI